MDTYLRRNRDLPCHVDGIKLGDHDSCDSCGILIGRSHMATTSVDFRGKHLCAHCHTRWQAVEARACKEVSFKKFTYPPERPPVPPCPDDGVTHCPCRTKKDCPVNWLRNRTNAQLAAALQAFGHR